MAEKIIFINPMGFISESIDEINYNFKMLESAHVVSDMSISKYMDDVNSMIKDLEVQLNSKIAAGAVSNVIGVMPPGIFLKDKTAREIYVKKTEAESILNRIINLENEVDRLKK